MKKGSFNHSAEALERARHFRSERSVSERVLWEQLRRGRTGFSFRTQVRVGIFFLDFYCAKAKLCVEVDGEQHANERDYDAWRDSELAKVGIETIRTPSLDLFVIGSPTFELWVKAITDRCAARSGVESMPRRRRHERY